MTKETPENWKNHLDIILDRLGELSAILLTISTSLNWQNYDSPSREYWLLEIELYSEKNWSKFDIPQDSSISFKTNISYS